MYHLSEADILSLAYDCLYAVWNMNERLTTRTPFIHNYYLIPTVEYEIDMNNN